MFRQRLHETDCAEIKTSTSANVYYKIFLKNFMFFYDEYFPIKRTKLKTKGTQNP